MSVLIFHQSTPNRKASKEPTNETRRRPSDPLGAARRERPNAICERAKTGTGRQTTHTRPVIRCCFVVCYIAGLHL